NALISASTPSAITWGCNINENKSNVFYSGSTTTTNCSLPGTTTTTTSQPADFTIKGLTEGAAISGGLTVEANPINAITPSFDFYLDSTLINTEKTSPFCLYAELNASCQPYGTGKRQWQSYPKGCYES